MSPLVLEKATSRIEQHLLKAAALAEIRANASPEARRRLLSTDNGPWRRLLDDDGEPLDKPAEDPINESLEQSEEDGTAEAPAPAPAPEEEDVDEEPAPAPADPPAIDDEEEGWASNSTVLNLGGRTFTPTAERLDPHEAKPFCQYRPGKAIEGNTLDSGYIRTSSPGECCAACLFRIDCYAWTVKGDGCQLYGERFTVKDDHATSGSMVPSVEWSPPKAPKAQPLERGKEKYGEVMDLVARFYQAQRSGKLPENYPIDWRRSAHVHDTVPGGWYDAGDTLKLNFPMSVSVSYMAWALVTFPKAFQDSGTYDKYLEVLKVANDYLLGCYDEKRKRYIGQIGDPDIDHASWHRPEDSTGKRPAFVWDDSMHGSDLLANTAAAWAASSLLFRESAPFYSKLLKKKAISIYAWAKTKEGKYSDFYRSAVYTIYPSSDYLDSQAWAAGWLYRVTYNRAYLFHANDYWSRATNGGQDIFNVDIYPGWDSLWAASSVLMRQISRKGAVVPGINIYDGYYEKYFLPSWLKADGTNGIVKTPRGMTYPSWNMWANLQFATTSSMIMMQDMYKNINLPMRQDMVAFAKRNVNYALGSSGRSFVAGYGANPPKYLHHAPATCPEKPEKCDDQNFYQRAANANVLDGALVGGPAGLKKNPDNPDYYRDIRSDYGTNEPACE